jgi:hypothetical protein
MSQIKTDKLFLLSEMSFIFERCPFSCTLECRYIRECRIPRRTKKLLIRAHKQLSLCLHFSVSFYYASQSRSWRLLFIVRPWHISRWADAVTLIWKNITPCSYFWNGLGHSQILMPSYSLHKMTITWLQNLHVSQHHTLCMSILCQGKVLIGNGAGVSKWIVKPTKIQGYVC